jgi:hypothetical protein
MKYVPPLWRLAYAHIFFKDLLAFDSAVLHTLQKPQPLPSPKGETKAKQPNTSFGDKTCICIRLWFPPLGDGRG